MFDTLLSTARRRQLGVYGALFAASARAACDKDQPTSPTPTPSSTTANALRAAIASAVAASTRFACSMVRTPQRTARSMAAGV